MTDEASPNSLRLSAVVITQNEERNLPGFLRNLSGVVDEIVIVDDGSTDRTAELAHAAGSHVIFLEHPMGTGGFAAQRNAGLAAATGDWILNMDCDERLSSELTRELQNVLPGSDLNGFRYRRLNYFMNRPMRHGGWDNWNYPQIARRGCHRFEGALHETCVIEGGAAKTGQLSGLMHHLNDFDFAHRLRKSALYCEMEAEKALSSGSRVGWLQIMFAPMKTFVKNFILKKGFQDGVPGLISGLHSASATFRINALVWDRQNMIEREILEAPFVHTRKGEVSGE